MPKMKTNRGAAKRFRRTARGKVTRHRSYSGHLMTSKSPRRRRRLRRKTTIAPVDMNRIEALLPYSRRKR
ncbi:MAG: 50S ribosomal protein L35 [Candidatus Zixiibacteriota bacterium]